jgi:hypothetical protein
LLGDCVTCVPQRPSRVDNKHCQSHLVSGCVRYSLWLPLKFFLAILTR